MKPLPLLVAALTLSILGGAIWYSEKHPPKGEADSDAKPAVKMVTAKEDQITKVRITYPGNPTGVTIEKDKGGWAITEPQKLPADEGSVKLLLTAITSLEAEQIVAEKNSDWQTFGLDTGKLKVEATLASGKPLEVIFGNEAPTGSPVYVRLAGDDRVFGVSGGTKTSFQKTSADLRDKRLLRVDADKVSKVTLTNAKNAGDQSLEFARKGAEWQIVKPRVMRADNYSVEDLVHAGSAAFDSIVDDDENGKEAKKHNFTKPSAVLTVVDAGGEHRLTVIAEVIAAPVAKKGAPPSDQGSGVFYYAKTTDSPGVYKLSQTSTASLTKPVEGYRNGRMFELALNDPDKIEVRDGNARLTLDKKTDAAKKEDQWFNGKMQVTSDKVQALLSQVRRLAAAPGGFTSEDGAAQAKYGLDHPVIEVKITGGGKVQRAVFAAQGEHYYAARDGDPATYEIAPLEVQDLKKFISDLK